MFFFPLDLLIGKSSLLQGAEWNSNWAPIRQFLGPIGPSWLEAFMLLILGASWSPAGPFAPPLSLLSLVLSKLDSLVAGTLRGQEATPCSFLPPSS